MMPGPHAAVSLAVGLLGWRRSRALVAIPLSLATGLLIDLDHAADYAWYTWRQEHRLILPLHGYEFALLLWLLVRRCLGSELAAVSTISYLLHLLSDEIGNQTKPGTYVLTWRLLNGFRLECMSRDPAAGIRGRQEDFDKLGRFFAR